MTQPGSKLTRLGIRLSHWFAKERRVLLTATSVTGCIVILRLVGALQSLELAALDQLFRLQPLGSSDKRIVIVSIDDNDISQVQRWPIPDGVMAELLLKIQAYQPRAIGLDIYRDLPVGSGQEQLDQVFASMPNLIGIEKIEDTESVGVSPSHVLEQNHRVGFNNVVVDVDGKVRRAVLFWNTERGVRTSFALNLALMYLKPQGIALHPLPNQPKYLQFGQSVLRPLKPSDGGYVRTDTGGYQILASPRHPEARFSKVTLSEVLANRVEPSLMRDRIVLIGSTAASLKDYFYTSYSSSLRGNAQPISGVELHASFISQLLNAATEGRSLVQVLPHAVEWLWITGWTMVGACLCWEIRSPERSAIVVLAASVALGGVCYIVLIAGWWIPMVPPLLGLLGSAVAITGYIAHLEEELKKSKEFLNSIINSIPDPVFVKDQWHRWIVLNEAYCRFVGLPLTALIEKTDHDFFSPQQADFFWQQDELAFSQSGEHESEEEFTDANGVTYSIATKRSLHRDAAGNLFLVGVIRDITRRKQIEDELRRTAAELFRSNAELREAKDSLTQMAYYDPLTGLPNRKLFQERLSQSLNWADRHSHLVALLFLDLDGFKLVNDSHGHQFGDLLLKAVAQRLTGCLRGSDTVARLGGDEFVVLLPAIPGQQDIARVAQKILDTLSHSFVLEGKVVFITTSIGISIYPLDSQTIDDLITCADMAMYDAKESGKNRYEFSAKEDTL
ncbi:CHASE2 domain-containing protein [Oculatella sp. LEGE 06141]|nr:CHASE2 domain-containing protein [Oculatella sp. LEGE 06141]